MNTLGLPPTSGRVERHTASHINQAIRARSDGEVTRLEDAPPEDIDARLAELAGNGT